MEGQTLPTSNFTSSTYGGPKGEEEREDKKGYLKMVHL